MAQTAVETNKEENMKLKKAIVLMLSLLFVFSFAIGTAAAQEEESEPSALWTALYDAEGNFTGINVKTATQGAAYLGVKSGMSAMTGKNIQLTVDLGENTLDPTATTGFFIKLSGPTRFSFSALLEDVNGDYWRAFNAASRTDSFVLEDGTLSSMSMSKNSHAFGTGWGTWYLPWKVLLPALGTASQTPAAISRIHFYLNLNLNSSSGSLWYSGQGVSISSVGTVTVNGAYDATAEVVLDASQVTATTDAENTSAGINTAAADLGTTFRADGGWDGSNDSKDRLTLKGDADYENFVAYGDISKTARKLTVRCVDEEGVQLLSDSEISVPFDKTEAKYLYSVSAPVVPDYDYLSADLPLEGELGAETEIIQLTYRVKEVPDLDWDEDPSHYDVTFDEFGGLASLNVKADMSKAVSMGLKKGLTEFGDLFAAMTLDFGETGTDTSKSTGLFVKMAGARTNYGFLFFITDAEGNRYFAYPSCVGKDLYTKEDGSTMSLTQTNTQHVFTQDVGTWYIPWSYFTKTDDGSPMSSGTVIRSCSFGMVMTKNSWYGGYGVQLASAGTVKVGINKTKVEVLWDTANFVFSDAVDETAADMNYADPQKGTKAYCREVFINQGGWTFYAAGSETFDQAIGNVELKPPSAEFSLRFVNEKGRDVKDAETLTFPIGGSYQITPPSILGYTFASSDLPLTGTVTGAVEIVLTYTPMEYTITLEFVDLDGNQIAESRQETYSYRDIYEFDEVSIAGYTFVESSRKLEGTVMGDMTITLTYQKNGCGGSLYASGGLVAMAAFLLAFGAAAVLRKKGA